VEGRKGMEGKENVEGVECMEGKEGMEGEEIVEGLKGGKCIEGVGVQVKQAEEGMGIGQYGRRDNPRSCLY
jgi:hypothetical protein